MTTISKMSQKNAQLPVFIMVKKKVSAIEEVENPQIVIGDKSRLKS